MQNVPLVKKMWHLFAFSDLPLVTSLLIDSELIQTGEQKASPD